MPSGRCRMQPCFGASNHRQHICVFSPRCLISWSAGLMQCPALERLAFSSPGLPISSRRGACLLAESWPSLSRARLQVSYSSALLHHLASGLPPRLFQVISTVREWHGDSTSPVWGLAQRGFIALQKLRDLRLLLRQLFTGLKAKVQHQRLMKRSHQLGRWTLLV